MRKTKWWYYNNRKWKYRRCLYNILNDKKIINNSKNELIYHPCELVSGEEKTIGAKYECDFGDEARNFYVLELGTNPVIGSTLESDEVALILEGNFDGTTQYWCEQSGTNSNDNVCAADGLNSKLDEITSKWTNLKNGQIGLPSVTQIVVADGKGEDEYTNSIKLTNSWLYNWPDNASYGSGAPYGYWTSSAFESSDSVWVVGYDSSVYSHAVNASVFGVRPVVNLKL